MALLEIKDPLELFMKRREFLPGSGFLSRRDMTFAVERNIKPKSFLPSFKGTITMEMVFTSKTYLKCYINFRHLISKP